ncbi:MAG: hypothetical protein ABSD49_07540 [Candidatus Bathyarchaeia archaeon]|jgi:hypothetical protein
MKRAASRRALGHKRDYRFNYRHAITKCLYGLENRLSKTASRRVSEQVDASYDGQIAAEDGETNTTLFNLLTIVIDLIDSWIRMLIALVKTLLIHWAIYAGLLSYTGKTEQFQKA